MITVQNTSSRSLSWMGIRGFHQLLPQQTLMMSEGEYANDNIKDMPGIQVVSEAATSPKNEETRMGTPPEEDAPKETLLEDFGEVVTPEHKPTIDVSEQTPPRKTATRKRPYTRKKK